MAEKALSEELTEWLKTCRAQKEEGVAHITPARVQEWQQRARGLESSLVSLSAQLAGISRDWWREHWTQLAEQKAAGATEDRVKADAGIVLRPLVQKFAQEMELRLRGENEAVACQVVEASTDALTMRLIAHLGAMVAEMDGAPAFMVEREAVEVGCYAAVIAARYREKVEGRR